MKQILARLSQSQTSRRSLWSLVGFIGNAVFALISALSIGRSLGAETFGVYVGVVGYVGIAAPLATMGTSQVLIARTGTNANAFGPHWRAMLRTLALLGVPMYVLTVLVGGLVLPGRALSALAVFGAIEFLTFGLLAGNGDACIAAERYGALAVHFLASSGVKAASGVAMVVFGWDDIERLASMQIVGVVAIAIISSLWVKSWVRPLAGASAIAAHEPGPKASAPTSVSTIRGESLIELWREGSSFAVSRGAQTLKGRTDVTMLLRSGLDTDAGLYGAGTRFIGYGTMPAQSVLVASYAEFFKRGAGGTRQAVRYGWRIARPAMALTMVGTVIAVVATPLVSKLMGPDFDNVGWIVLAMAGLPLVRTASVVVGNVLTGAGHQGLRSQAEIASALANVALNVALIPIIGLAGAIIATYLSEAAMLVLLVIRVRKRCEVEVDPTEKALEASAS